MAALCAALSAAPAKAAVPSGFTDTLVVSGLTNPTAMAFAPDGRLFVTQQGGSLRVVKNGQLLATPFLTVPVDSSGERGLLGVAFDPAFASNGYVYVYYTATTPVVHNRVSRFTAAGDVAAPGSEQVILELDNLSAAKNHNGGAIHFGRDGKLYVGVGENAKGANAQLLTNLLGKLLRINSDGSIPTDNPFYKAAAGRNRAIWALGLRNPFTFAVQPGSGRIFINDVGAQTWEEVNHGIAGSNYGWPASEGPTSDPGFRSPIFAYGHGTGPTLGCAIAGGAFYNPQTAQFPPTYVGDYLFADLCGGWIRKLEGARGDTVTDFATGISSPVDLQLASDGSLHYLARGSGSVRRIRYVAPIISSFSPESGAAGSTQVTITGRNLTGATSVKFDGRSASYTVLSPTTIDATVPNGATTGRITVTTPTGTATSPAPFAVTFTLTSFAPRCGPRKTRVTVNGAGFTNPSTVRFNGVTAAATGYISSARLLAVVPADATSGPLTVVRTSSPTTTQSPTAFTVTPVVAPSISKLTPTSGQIGTSVVISGQHLCGASSVKFNGTAASFTVVSGTQLRATVPAGATSGPISVTTPAGKATSASSFTVTG